MGTLSALALVDASWPYGLVALAAFIGGSLLPLSSEAALVAQIKTGYGMPWGLAIAATIGNTLGGVFNWWLGKWIVHFQTRPWFPFTPGQIEHAEVRFKRWGIWVLPFTWFPIIGDVLTFVAGSFRVPLWLFVPLVAIGRFARYAVIVWGMTRLGWI
ncbi:MAG: hypothetical protein RL291_1085 [Pseudomonadota bacterium]